MNDDTDSISCESCGAHLYFSAPASWSKQQGMFFCVCIVESSLCVCVCIVNKLGYRSLLVSYSGESCFGLQLEVG